MQCSNIELANNTVIHPQVKLFQPVISTGLNNNNNNLLPSSSSLRRRIFLSTNNSVCVLCVGEIINSGTVLVGPTEHFWGSHKDPQLALLADGLFNH